MEIDRYTQETWGSTQADRYLNVLHTRCLLLAENPLLGRHWDLLAAGIHRSEVEKHVIFFTLRPQGIRIERILHQSMLPDAGSFPN